MMRLTLAIAGRTLFDVDVERDSREIAEALDLSLRMFGYTMLPFGYLMEHVPLGWVRDLRRARARMDLIIYRLIAERRATGTDHGDLLSMLVAARDEGDGTAEGDGSGMTDHQLRDEVVTLLMAGHETTANALTWALHLLSENPEAERALHAEVDAVLGRRAPTMDDLPRLRYARAVIAESLRLRPPAWIVERLALEDFEAGGYVIGRGALVLASQYLVHRDPRWWPEAERFLPERWLDDDANQGAPRPNDAAAGASRPKMAYFPFGGGTRICIGEQFAWMEGTLVLATIARRWRLRYAGQRAPEPEPLITLRPKGGMPMALERRMHREPDTQ
jgi:cytochrome P450